MSQNYLLEIGLEEIPAHVVTPSINQLVERMTSFLKENRLSFDNRSILNAASFGSQGYRSCRQARRHRGIG